MMAVTFVSPLLANYSYKVFYVARILLGMAEVAKLKFLRNVLGSLDHWSNMSWFFKSSIARVGWKFLLSTEQYLRAELWLFKLFTQKTKVFSQFSSKNSTVIKKICLFGVHLQHRIIGKRASSEWLKRWKMRRWCDNKKEWKIEKFKIFLRKRRLEVMSSFFYTKVAQFEQKFLICRRSMKCMERSALIAK